VTRLGDSPGERPPSLPRSLPNKTAAGGPSTQRHRADEGGEDGERSPPEVLCSRPETGPAGVVVLLGAVAV
jgi:hypothetical protein